MLAVTDFNDTVAETETKSAIDAKFILLINEAMRVTGAALNYKKFEYAEKLGCVPFSAT